ncbi:hypothetical protein RCZ15_01040 [Capnocytophaga catalasegens]|uniref:Uncharacterized protein n=2 Tax=Capnocytophaga catalasegens TaxID=1004260 RepID=A0AAV5AVU5_9FLAO|nr:hypothetical protein RCZ03_23460 [Capnocytophaga catalasegens]GJM49128.1 hypothetical protein RCZ15_01040 [Capnocytophaga catalasegens]GJM53688.1 hypothetical protein RCZ16_20040 [Capnocytophaga catalasegens]
MYGNDWYYSIRQLTEAETLPKREVYYYFGTSYFTTEKRYKYREHIELENTNLIEYPMVEDVYFNQNNEFIYSRTLYFKKRLKEFIKLDSNGNQKDSVVYSDDSFVYDDKSVDFETNSYSNWLNSGDTTSVKIKVLNQDFSFSL